MVNKYTIKVANQSGSQQHYALFAKPPIVTGRVQGQIWSNVFATANTPRTENAKFSIYTQYYAIVGSSQGSPAAGVEVDVAGERAVNLGYKDSNGLAVPGSTLGFKVIDDAPQFSEVTFANSSYVDAYEIKTSADFTIAQAKAGNFMIGLGGSKTGTSSSGPAATFIPEPNVDYQIQPVNTYYLTFGSYTPGTLIDVDKIGSSVSIDFTQLGPDVTVVHDDHGVLNIQSS